MLRASGNGSTMPSGARGAHDRAAGGTTGRAGPVEACDLGDLRRADARRCCWPPSTRRSWRPPCRPSSGTSAAPSTCRGWSPPTCSRPPSTTPLWGKLGDLYGRKILFITVHRHLPRRLGTRRHVADDGAAHRLAGRPGRRRRRAHGPGAGDHRRRRPAPGPRPVPGRVRCGLRAVQRGRAAARRVLRRPPVLALGLLRQPPHRRARARRGRRGAAGDEGADVHRRSTSGASRSWPRSPPASCW